MGYTNKVNVLCATTTTLYLSFDDNRHTVTARVFKPFN